MQVSLTNGASGASQLVLAQPIFPLGFNSTGDGSFCIGTEGSASFGCIVQDTVAGTINAYGAGTASGCSIECFTLL
jgi:hypothetical protein